MTERQYKAQLRALGWSHMGTPGAHYVHPDGGEVGLWHMRDWGDGVEELWRYAARNELVPDAERCSAVAPVMVEVEDV